MLVTIFNDNGKPKWAVKLSQNGDKWEISETAKYSLFSNPLSIGATAGECLDNFLAIEQKLIDNL